MRRGVATVVLGLAVSACSSGSGTPATVPVETIPQERARAAADYTIALFESGADQADAFELIAAAATIEQQAAGLEAMAGAIATQVSRLESIAEVPAEAEALHGTLVEVLGDYRAWYEEAARATRAGDQARVQALSLELLGIQTEYSAAMVEQARLGRMVLASLPPTGARSYLIEVLGVTEGGPIGLIELQVALQEALSAGDLGAAIGALELIVELLDGAIETFERIDPPPEAAEYHSAYLAFSTASRDAMEDLLKAIRDEDLAATQSASIRMAEAARDSGRLQTLIHGLVVEALRP